MIHRPVSYTHLMNDDYFIDDNDDNDDDYDDDLLIMSQQPCNKQLYRSIIKSL